MRSGNLEQLMNNMIFYAVCQALYSLFHIPEYTSLQTMLLEVKSGYLSLTQVWHLSIMSGNVMIQIVTVN